MIRPLVPPGLLHAADVALESETRMRPEHIAGVAEWLTQLIALNVDDPVKLSVNELILISQALNDAIRLPIARIPETS